LPLQDTIMNIRAVVCATLLSCAQGLFKYPWHASCKIQWDIPHTCSHFRERIVDQMNAWQGDSMCPTTSPSCPELPCGQNCLYQVQQISDNFISGTHQTPVARYTDDLTFRLTPSSSGGCSVAAKSSSQTWYAVLDMGTNYCNLRNLLDGAGLSSSAGFSEVTSNSVCTQYESRDCSRY